MYLKLNGAYLQQRKVINIGMCFHTILSWLSSSWANIRFNINPPRKAANESPCKSYGNFCLYMKQYLISLRPVPCKVINHCPPLAKVLDWPYVFVFENILYFSQIIIPQKLSMASIRARTAAFSLYRDRTANLQNWSARVLFWPEQDTNHHHIFFKL